MELTKRPTHAAVIMEVYNGNVGLTRRVIGPFKDSESADHHRAKLEGEDSVALYFYKVRSLDSPDFTAVRTR